MTLATHSTSDNRLSLLEGVVGAVSVGAIIIDDTHRVVLWNHWMEKHSGLASKTVLGENFFDLYPETRGKRIEAAVKQALCNNFPSLLSQTLNKAPIALYTTPGNAANGLLMQQAVAVIPLDVAGTKRHCLIQITDVSLAVAREKLLRQQALVLHSQSFSDGLTGIANRRHFDVVMEKETRRAKRSATTLSLAMIDIDYFKAYNDHYGHQRGDDCLIQVAHALAGMLHRPADLVARYGGEEFGVILPDIDAENGMALAGAIRTKIETMAIEHAKSGVADHVTVSVGLATQTPENHNDASTLIGSADRALYEAKRLGRNRVVLGR